MKEITYDELSELPKDTYELIDIRDEGLTAYGMIPGAVHIYVEELDSSTALAEIPRDKKLVFYCEIGRISREIDDTLDYLEGRDCYSLSEGYVGYIRSGIKSQADKEEKRKCAEESIQKKFHKQLFSPFAKACKIYKLIFESTIFDTVDTIEKSPCYLCARMRRGYLYSKAKELGCNKIALGHHYDDVIETILMGMIHGAQIQTMMPKLHSTNFEGMELIRPLYLVREADICAWRDYNDLHFLQCACHFTDTCTTCHEDGTTSSKRLETKKLIAELKKTNPFVESNIFNSMENVNLDTVIEYKKNGVRHNFLDEY